MFSNYCWPGFRKTGVLSEVLNNEMCTCNRQKKDIPIYRKGKKHTKEHELEERSVCPLDRGLLTRPWSRGPRTQPPGVGSKHPQGPGKRPNSTHWETVSWSSLHTFTADSLRRAQENARTQPTGRWSAGGVHCRPSRPTYSEEVTCFISCEYIL